MRVAGVTVPQSGLGGRQNITVKLNLLTVLSAATVLHMGAIATSAQSTWQVTLNVAEVGGIDTDLTFGVHPDATNGVDAALGEVVQAPLPPAGNWDARFSDNGGLLIDIRSSANGTAHVLPLSYQRASGGDVTLTWNQARLTDYTTGTGGVAAKIQDQFGGILVDVDMTTTNTVTISNAAIAALNLIFTSTDDFTPPDATVLAFTTVPAEVTSTIPFNVVVNATDHAGVVQAGAVITITLEAGPGSVAAGATGITDASGNATISVTYTQVAGGETFDLTATTTSNLAGATVTMNSGVSEQLSSVRRSLYQFFLPIPLPYRIRGRC